MLLAEVDANNDGSITYQEFAPLAVQTVQTMRLKEKYAEHAHEVGKELREAAAAIIGQTPDALAAFVQKQAASIGDRTTLTKQQPRRLEELHGDLEGEAAIAGELQLGLIAERRERQDERRAVSRVGEMTGDLRER